MATYNRLEPTLAALYTTKDDPQGTEPVSVMDDALRQTRNWLYEFLSLYIDPGTGKLRSSAFTTGSVPPEVIRGTNPVDGRQRELAAGTVQGADLADRAVSGAKIGVGAVTDENIAVGSIDANKLKDASITSAKLGAGILSATNIAAGAINNEKIATGTITADKLSGNTLTKDQLGKGSVTGFALPTATAGQILVGGNGSDGKELAVKTLSGVISIDKDGATSFSGSILGNALTYARVVEKTSNGTGGGSAETDGWQRRGAGNSPPWAIENTTREFLEISQGAIYFMESGRYLVEARVPAYNTNGHVAMLIYVPNPGIVSNDTVRVYWGTQEDNNATTQTSSTIRALIDVDVPSAATGQARPYFFIAHWTAGNGGGTDSLGRKHTITATPPAPLTAASPYYMYYADMTILKLQDTTET